MDAVAGARRTSGRPRPLCSGTLVRSTRDVAASFRPTVVAAALSFLGDVAASSWPAVATAVILRRCGVTLRFVGATVGLVLCWSRLARSCSCVLPAAVLRSTPAKVSERTLREHIVTVEVKSTGLLVFRTRHKVAKGE